MTVAENKHAVSPVIALRYGEFRNNAMALRDNENIEEHNNANIEDILIKSSCFSLNMPPEGGC